MDHNVLYQDNKSTILLAKNGRWSTSKRTKHINNRYFLVKDKIEGGELEIEHKGTGEMWSDMLIKPLQGHLWYVMKSNLMNVPVDYDDKTERRNTHPDLLPTEELDEKVQRENGTVLKR